MKRNMKAWGISWPKNYWLREGLKSFINLNSKVIRNRLLISTRKLKDPVKKRAQERGVHIEDHDFVGVSYPNPADLMIPGTDLPWVFTSQHAVKAILAAKPSPVELERVNCYCIAGKTEQLAMDNGFKVKGIAKDSMALARLIDQNGERGVHHLTSNIRLEDLANYLKKKGIRVNVAEVYLKELDTLEVNKPYWGILFFSPSQVKSFKIVNKLDPKSKVFCIGKTTASALEGHPNVYIASGHSEEKMMESVYQELN